MIVAQRMMVLKSGKKPIFGAFARGCGDLMYGRRGVFLRHRHLTLTPLMSIVARCWYLRPLSAAFKRQDDAGNRFNG